MPIFLSLLVFERVRNPVRLKAVTLQIFLLLKWLAVHSCFSFSFRCSCCLVTTLSSRVLLCVKGIRAAQVQSTAPCSSLWWLCWADCWCCASSYAYCSSISCAPDSRSSRRRSRGRIVLKQLCPPCHKLMVLGGGLKLSLSMMHIPGHTTDQMDRPPRERTPIVLSRSSQVATVWQERTLRSVFRFFQCVLSAKLVSWCPHQPEASRLPYTSFYLWLHNFASDFIPLYHLMPMFLSSAPIFEKNLVLLSWCHWLFICRY